MLNRLHIENYKCLRDVTVDLSEFTVLVGANDSGKTSFLEAVKLLGGLADGFPQALRDGDSLESLVWRNQRDRRFVWEVSGQADQQHFKYRVELPANGKAPLESLEFGGARVFFTEVGNQNGREMIWNKVTHGNATQQSAAQAHSTFLARSAQQGNAACRAVAAAINSSIEYRFDVKALQQPSIPQNGDRLKPNGENLAGILDLMQNSADRSSFDSLQDDLHAAVPTIQRILLPPARQPQGNKALGFVLAGQGHPPVTIPASQTSTGVLLLTAFLALVYSETSSVLLLEEPENGLHPSRLRFVVDQLRKICSGETGGRKRQVIVTTHSPVLLNYARPDEVQVFVRDPDQGTEVKSITDVPDFDTLAKEFAVGDLWYLLGEKNLFEARQT